VAVASAGPYANLHLTTDNHTSTPPLSFLLAGCPSYHPTNSIKAHQSIQTNLASHCDQKIPIVQSKYEIKHLNPQKIARKRFMMFLSTIMCGEQHTKSLPESDHHKGPNYDVIK